jgi:uncharacterized protein
MPALIIFIKNPIKGQVKTRIARTTGDERALEIYLELSKITRENAVILRGVDVYLFYSDFINYEDEWSNNHFKKEVQTGSDLGERMLNAFNLVLKKHNFACIIGSDCPTLSVEILQNSFEKLTHFDTVLGPSTDGGYYLLGIKNKEKSTRNDGFNLKKALKCLFYDMVWSTSDVLQNTLKRIKQNNQTVFLLPELTDIDEETDWLLFQKTDNLYNRLTN